MKIINLPFAHPYIICCTVNHQKQQDTIVTTKTKTRIVSVLIRTKPVQKWILHRKLDKFVLVVKPNATAKSLRCFATSCNWISILYEGVTDWVDWDDVSNENSIGRRYCQTT